ncbi:hypothetical protein [Pontibacterium sp.]|uniref:hypothetical protein n=1 Tax=Pontibacterium sp. TaxID=2036026 RepID=UPI0035646934
MSDKKYLSSQIDWLREQLRPYCNKRSQKLIACAVELAITDVMADRGIVLDEEFCNRYGLPAPLRTLEYTYEQSLFVVLTHDSFYPDFSAIKGKFSPTAIYAATALVRIDRAQLLLASGDFQASSYNVDMAKRLKENLASVLKRDERQKKLIADSKTEHISYVRTQAIKETKRYSENAKARQSIADYFEAVKTIIKSNKSYEGVNAQDIERLAIKVALTPGNGERYKAGQKQLTDADKCDLLNAADKMLLTYDYELEEGYLRRIIKRLTNF